MGLVGCKQKEKLAEKTLGGYIRLAATWWKEALGIEVLVYWPALPARREAKTESILGGHLAAASGLEGAKGEEGAFHVQIAFLNEMTVADASFFLSVVFVVGNWMHLSVLTGSYVGGYGQSKPRKGKLFATIPYCLNAGKWVGMPLAFVHADFTFYDANQTLCGMRLTHCSGGVCAHLLLV